jgi:folate-dependent phosphoribosylglycinamide formyltransferase PurN
LCRDHPELLPNFEGRLRGLHVGVNALQAGLNAGGIVHTPESSEGAGRLAR